MADYFNDSYYTPEIIDPTKIFNPAQQVRKRNANVKIDDIEGTLHLYGLTNPIIVCESTISREQSDYDYHLVDGQRRLTACLNQKMKDVPIRVYKKGQIIPEEEIEALATILNITNLAMKKGDIWDQIKKQYFLNGNDAKKTAQVTGFPYEIVKEAVAEHRIDEIPNARKVMDYIVDKGLLESHTTQIMDRIIDICLKDNNTVDLPKAKKLHDVLVGEDYPVQKNILAAAEMDPQGEVKTWQQDGKNQVITTNISVPFAQEEKSMIESYLEANELGVNVKQFIYDLVMDEVK
tara:strand:- start:339 stop:1214 length:876 start_codon:yes stop_codon:yes gene_type:complete